MNKIIELVKSNKIDEVKKYILTFSKSEKEQIRNQKEVELMSQVLFFIYYIIQDLVNNNVFNEDELHDYKENLALFKNNSINLSKISLKKSEHMTQDIDQYKIIFDGVSFPIQDFEQINLLFRVLGSNKMIQWGKYNDQIEILVGEGTYKKIGDFNIHFLTKELAFTPNIITAMAAMINEQTILIRMEAIKNIVLIKWSSNQLIENSNLPLPHLCSSKIKDIVFSKVNSSNRLEQIENHVSHNVLMHELGHASIQHDVLPLKLASFAEAFQNIDETIIECILEILADFSPKNDQLCGVFYSLIEIAKTDYIKAEQCFWIYFSDTWFYDTEITSMYTYSNIIITLLARYINNDYSINFDQLEKEWSQTDSKSIINIVINFLEDVITDFISQFNLDYDLNYIENEADKYSIYKENVKLSNDILKNCYKENKKEVELFLVEKKKMFFTDLMNRLNSIVLFTDDDDTNKEKILSWFKQYFDL
mgnify:CR=1 FL=1